MKDQKGTHILVFALTMQQNCMDGFVSQKSTRWLRDVFQIGSRSKSLSSLSLGSSISEKSSWRFMGFTGRASVITALERVDIMEDLFRVLKRVELFQIYENMLVAAFIS